MVIQLKVMKSVKWKARKIWLAQVEGADCAWAVGEETSFGNTINQVLLKDSSSQSIIVL